jgi:hypothetical protein
MNNSNLSVASMVLLVVQSLTVLCSLRRFFSISTQKQYGRVSPQQNQQLGPFQGLHRCTEALQFLCSGAHFLCNSEALP